MSLSTGTYHVDLDGQFAEVIGALALANVREEWSRDAGPGVEKYADLVSWIRQSHKHREPWVMQLVIGAATKSNQSGSPSATKVMAPVLASFNVVDTGWFDRELAFWSGSDATALAHSLGAEAAAALERKLPDRLGAEEALRWTQELVASLR